MFGRKAEKPAQSAWLAGGPSVAPERCTLGDPQKKKSIPTRILGPTPYKVPIPVPLRMSLASFCSYNTPVSALVPLQGQALALSASPAAARSP